MNTEITPESVSAANTQTVFMVTYKQNESTCIDGVYQFVTAASDRTTQLETTEGVSAVCIKPVPLDASIEIILN